MKGKVASPQDFSQDQLDGRTGGLQLPEFTICGLGPFWGSKQPFNGIAYQPSCLPDSYTMVHNSSEITVVKQELKSFYPWGLPHEELN